ncbi:hypothetical protein D3C77_290480 [compost metagenome]
MAVAAGEGAQVGNDRGHAPGQFTDQLEVATGIVGALVVEQNLGVFCVAADRRQRLVEFVADARRHGPQHRQLAGLDQFILGAHQLLLGVFAFQYLAFQAAVEAFKVGGTLDDTLFQLLAPMGLEVDAVHVMASTLHHQAQQQHQHQQGCGTNGQHCAHRAVDDGPWRQDAGLPTGFFDGFGLDQPGSPVEVQWLRRLGRVGLDRNDRFAFGIGQRPGGAEAPVGARGQDDHAIVVGDQQLLRRLAP